MIVDLGMAAAWGQPSRNSRGVRVRFARVLPSALGAVLLVSFVPQLYAQEPVSAATGLATSDLADRLSDAPLPTRAFETSLDLPRGDGRRTLGRFVPNLGRNLVGVFSRDNLKPLVWGLAASGVSRLGDNTIKTRLEGKAEDFGVAGQGFGGATVMAPLALSFFTAGRFASDTRFRAASYDVGQALIVTGLYTDILKRAANRTRPDFSNNKSFPSGHTSNAFALATVVNAHYGRKAGAAAYAVAGLVGASRIERNKHYLSDVVAGAALGVIVGRTVTREDGEPLRGQKHFSLGPSFAPSGAGVGIGLSVDF
jgi:membrane-associated phospholipid phosphatase